jgi:hypothetical protein
MAIKLPYVGTEKSGQPHVLTALVPRTLTLAGPRHGPHTLSKSVTLPEIHPRFTRPFSPVL